MNEVWQSLQWRRVAVYIALYLLLSYLAIAFINTPDQVTLLWPASGLALAFVLRYGLVWCLPMAVSIVLVHILINPVPMAFLPFSVSSNIIGVLIAVLYVRSREFDRMLSIKGGFTMIQGALLMCLISGLIGVAGLYLNGMMGSSFWLALLKWSLGDLLGIICIAPATLLVISPVSKDPDSPPASGYDGPNRRLLWSFLLLLALALIFFGGYSTSPYVLSLAMLPIALVVWSAIRLPPVWTTVGNALSVLAVTGMIGLGLGGFKPPSDFSDTVFLLVFLCLMAIFPLILMASNHESRKSAQKLFRRATTDAETGLPNRTAFEDAARSAIDGIGPVRTLAYLDFDHFKVVNDTASHEAGDALIKGVASMLAAGLYPDDRVFRIGGDEFAMLMMCEGREADLRAQRVLRAIETFRTGWKHHILSTTASIGLATLRPGKSEFAQLLSQADAACFTAKEQGGNRICVAGQDSPALQMQTDAMEWAVRIRQALAQNHFELECQDILPLTANGDTGRCFEVLLRMRDPASGRLLPPGLFIPAAERFHLGTRIDRHVIDLLLTWMDAHPEHAESVAACSINLSAASMEDESFALFMRNRLNKSRFPAYKIIFEITETSAMLDLSRAQALIADLRRIGCRFALDDFGTGFCSFKYLQDLEVDMFKIDGGFVRDLETSDLSKAVIHSITYIAHVLNKTTVAEHCESEAMITQLRELGVDKVQGYGIHKPQPIDDYFARTA
ncbi:MAG: EAL domain-containing protein [Arenimonas sp.]|uniref:bifunctional diguanylate cyclase/phosphodiesterase n=1 Tax=Arenimonas sp. TaxID=1872635 RepID=UPI003C0DB21C